MESKIKEAKQNCRKESKCKFKKWRKKIVKSIYDGYKVLDSYKFLIAIFSFYFDVIRYL